MQSSIKPLVIPVFIPHSGCPHMCAFCNQSIITNEKACLPDAQRIEDITDEYLNFKGKRNPVQLAFFGGNFLGLETSYMLKLLNIANKLKKSGKIDSIRFSTRPDTISKKSLNLIKDFPISTIELGVQSMNDEILKLSNRGHTSECTIVAASLLKKYGFEIGMQMMVGLPKENEKSTLKSAQAVLNLKPDFIRIYPLIVLKGSLIAKWYKSGKYKPLNLDKCVTLVKKIYTLFNDQNIPVIRMGLQASEMLQDDDSMIAGPWHPAFGHLVFSEIFFDKAKTIIKKNLDKNPDTNVIVLKVNPSSESKLRGDKNNNMERLKQIFPKIDFRINTDISINKESVSTKFFIDKKELPY
ncbi:MAG: radical SAM protein [Desulfobacteraceae bacterium]|nr:radical SAM protein [Desulfobacteraceae bacterium]